MDGTWRKQLAKLRSFSPLVRRSSAEAQREADRQAFDELRAAHHELEASHRDISTRMHPLAYARAEAERIGAAPFLDWAPPGHFYSSVPALSELEARDEELFSPPWPESLPGVDLNRDGQRALIEKLAPYDDGYDFPVSKEPGRRYFRTNDSYDIADSLILHAMIREYQPRRIIEVGSGYSSCMILDTVDGHVDHDVAVTLIEPYPELVESLLGPADVETIEIIAEPVQQVPVERFTALEADDILFIDSSHVVKTGSDVIFEILEILPRLARGVVVHLHDIFYPFEYSRPWVHEGRAWSEAYLLRAFLAYNTDFEVLFFNDYLGKMEVGHLERYLPKMLPHAGGAIWLRRR